MNAMYAGCTAVSDRSRQRSNSPLVVGLAAYIYDTDLGKSLVRSGYIQRLDTDLIPGEDLLTLATLECKCQLSESNNENNIRKYSRFN